jgi:hypothetical protein
MTVRHPDIIQALIEGKDVEYRGNVNNPDGEWYPLRLPDRTVESQIICVCSWGHTDYRVKPKTVVLWQNVYAGPARVGNEACLTGSARATKESARINASGRPRIGILRLEFSEDMTTLISATMEKP